MRCTIDAEARGQTTVLRGRVTSPDAAAGAYRLVVRISGPSGSADTAQGGEFRAERGVDATVGEIGFNIDGGRRFDATLTITRDGRTVKCRRSGP